MSHSVSQRRCLLGLSFVLFLASLGCEAEPRARLQKGNQEPAKVSRPTPSQSPPPAVAAPAAQPPSQAAPSKRVQLGKSVWFENEDNQRRVLVETTVCLREGGLECLLCRKQTKEHESILATDADAQVIHTGLLAAGAQAGSPVQYVEKQGSVVVVPPTGSRIKIFVQYEEKGKLITLPAQQWILNAKTKKDLEDEWVFAGSRLLPSLNGENEKPVYAATSDGSYICVYNMPFALLDLPVNNPNRDPEIRDLQPHTNRIPPLQTKVLLILEPQRNDKASS